MIKLKQVKWGIIGVGDVCEVKSGPAFQKVDNSDLVAVMRRSGEKAQDYAIRHGVSKWYDDADTLINDPEINAIYIATPPNVHEYYVNKAAASGKAIYVEKPMAMNHEACKTMMEVCEKNRVPMFVAYYRRALPNFLKVKDLLAKGVIGDIRYVDVQINKSIEPDILQGIVHEDNWRVNPEVSGGGYFHDLACHQLDLLDFLLGPIKKAQGYSKNQAGFYKADDMTIANFTFESGVLGRGVWCFNSTKSAEIELTTIVGSRGKIEFDCFSEFGVHLAVDGQPVENLNFEMPNHIQQPLIQSIVNQLTGHGDCASTGESGARTAWVMDQIIG